MCKHFPEKSDAGIKFMHIGVVELLEGAVVQCLADALHQVIVEVQVVHDSQAHAQQLVRFLQMADIRAGEIAADRAVTVRVDGRLVALVFQVLDIDDAVPGEQMPVARVAAGMTQSNRSTPR